MPDPTNHVDQLVAALKEEFGEGVQFHQARPASVSAPSVIVTPGDPFITNHSLGQVKENWEVLVVVSYKEPKSAITALRQLSLRVRRSVSSVGAMWQSASGPRTLAQDATAKQLILSVNEVTLAYPPGDQVPTN